MAPGIWTHLASTYDGSNLRLYVNGTQVSSIPLSGPVTVSGGALRIGGNTVWGEWFSGRIDEVRIYDRALSGLELGADMLRPVLCSSGPAQPVLGVTPSTLSFAADHGGPSPDAKTISIGNDGTGTLNWTAADDADWLSVSPANGSGPGTVTVTPATNGLAAGTYTATVTLSAPGATGSPKTVPVTLTVTPPAPPTLSVTPSSLAFTATRGGADPATKTLTVSSGGLNWTVSDDAPWLTVTPGAGSITVAAATGSLAGRHPHRDDHRDGARRDRLAAGDPGDASRSIRRRRSRSPRRRSRSRPPRARRPARRSRSPSRTPAAAR